MMEVHCGAVEHIDYQIGRVVEAIEQLGDLDNTLIIYCIGDNGPTPEGGLHGEMNKLTAANGVAESLDEVAKHLDDFGGPSASGGIPAAWAYATNGPYYYGKLVTSGGGCSTAFAISWPARIKAKGGLRSQFTHLIDVVPTILEAGVPAPKVVNGIVQKPLDGVTMTYTFDDAKAMDRRTTQYFELNGSRATQPFGIRGPRGVAASQDGDCGWQTANHSLLMRYPTSPLTNSVSRPSSGYRPDGFPLRGPDTEKK